LFRTLADAHAYARRVVQHEDHLLAGVLRLERRHEALLHPLVEVLRVHGLVVVALGVADKQVLGGVLALFHCAWLERLASARLDEVVAVVRHAGHVARRQRTIFGDRVHDADALA